jgi:hypothetical protein
MVGIDNDSSATAANTVHEESPATDHATLQHNTRQPLSLNRARKALNEVWRVCFAHNNTTGTAHPVLAANLQPANNQSWGPDAHTQEDTHFRICFQNLNGIP